MVRGDPGGSPSAQGPAVLSSVRRERRNRIRRLRVRAEFIAGQQRRAGAASPSRGSFRPGRPRRLSPARGLDALEHDPEKWKPVFGYHAQTKILTLTAWARALAPAVGPVAVPVSCALRRHAVAALPAISSAALQTPSDRSA